MSRSLFADRGRQAFAQGKSWDAYMHFTKAIECEPSNPDAVLLANRSAAAQILGWHMEALSDAVESTRLDPAYAKGWGRVGRALLSLGEFSTAHSCYTTALDLDPTNGNYVEGVAITARSVTIDTSQTAAGAEEPRTSRSPAAPTETEPCAQHGAVPPSDAASTPSRPQSALPSYDMPWPPHERHDDDLHALQTQIKQLEAAVASVPNLRRGNKIALEKLEANERQYQELERRHAEHVASARKAAQKAKRQHEQAAETEAKLKEEIKLKERDTLHSFAILTRERAEARRLDNTKALRQCQRELLHERERANTAVAGATESLRLANEHLQAIKNAKEQVRIQHRRDLRDVIHAREQLTVARSKINLLVARNKALAAERDELAAELVARPPLARPRPVTGTAFVNGAPAAAASSPAAGESTTCTAAAGKQGDERKSLRAWTAGTCTEGMVNTKEALQHSKAPVSVKRPLQLVAVPRPQPAAAWKQHPQHPLSQGPRTARPRQYSRLFRGVSFTGAGQPQQRSAQQVQTDPPNTAAPASAGS